MLSLYLLQIVTYNNIVILLRTLYDLSLKHLSIFRVHTHTHIIDGSISLQIVTNDFRYQVFFFSTLYEFSLNRKIGILMIYMQDL